MPRTEAGTVDSLRHKHAGASAMLTRARVSARLQLLQVGPGIGVHPRTIRRWELGMTCPRPDDWTKITAYYSRFVPDIAVELARLVGVSSPVPQPAPTDVRAIEDAILRAADLLDVSPRRVRAAVRELCQATAAAHGTLADLARAGQERPATP